jgi:hypothetical protein
MFGAKYLTSPERFTGWNEARFRGAALELALAGDRYRFYGLEREGQAVVRRLYPLSSASPCDSASTAVEVAVSREPDSEFKRFDLSGWEYDLDLAYTDAAVQIAGLGFAAAIVLEPTFVGRLWTGQCASEDFRGVFENFLRILVAYRLLQRGGVLLHSAALVIGQAAHVFVGRSGHGKSTLSAIAAGAGGQVISDDLNAVVPNGDAAEVSWTPFYGDVRSSFDEPGRWPLSGFYLIQKSPHNLLSEEPKAAVLTRLLSCSPYVNRDPHRLPRLLENLSRICDGVSCRRLEFRKDRGFMDLLGVASNPDVTARFVTS